MERINLKKQVYSKNEVNNVINVNDFSNNYALDTLPDIVGYDGGSPEAIFTEQTPFNLSMLDGGNVNGN